MTSALDSIRSHNRQAIQLPRGWVQAVQPSPENASRSAANVPEVVLPNVTGWDTVAGEPRAGVAGSGPVFATGAHPMSIVSDETPVDGALRPPLNMDAPAASSATQTLPPTELTRQMNALWGQAEFRKTVGAAVDELVRRYPPSLSAVALLAAADSAPSCDIVAWALAKELAARKVGAVLLVDGESEERRLSHALGVGWMPGLTECVNRGSAVSESAVPSVPDPFDILPAGLGQLVHRKLDPLRVGGLVAAIKRLYRYTLVSAGAAKGTLATHLGPLSDFCLLTASLHQTDRRDAAEAVEHLRQSAARLIGCITLAESRS
jgi:Mrp family chromosome partitioning ATPase